MLNRQYNSASSLSTIVSVMIILACVNFTLLPRHRNKIVAGEIPITLSSLLALMVYHPALTQPDVRSQFMLSSRNRSVTPPIDCRNMVLHYGQYD